MLSIGKSAESQVWENDFEIEFEDLSKFICASPWSHLIWMPAVRREQNFYVSKYVALDFDEGMTKVEAQQRFENEGLKYIIGTSRNDMLPKGGKPACDRFRALFEWEKPIFDRDVYQYNVKLLIEKYGTDDQGSDLARMWFPCKDIWAIQPTGKTIPFTTDIPFDQTKEFRQEEFEKHLKKYKGKKTIPKRALNFLNGAVQSGSRNNDLFYTVLTLLQIGKKEEEFLPRLRALPFFYEINGETTVKSAFKKFSEVKEA